jgi:ubiquinol-cytochrome c reductase cytochrome c1 subunit
MVKLAAIAWALLLPALSLAAEAEAPQSGADWQSWRANNVVATTDSLQRGARNFMNYCVNCHSLKYLRYSRMATDLKIPPDLLSANLLPPGAKPADYIVTTLRSEDGVAWFGKQPPDLSLIARSRGPDYLFRFLKTFYVDPSRPTRTNNLQLPNASMPAVLSELEGVKEATFRAAPAGGSEGAGEKQLDHFTITTPGQLTAEQYDGFVRDTVNFLDYVGEPAQVSRRSMGVWVVLFLLAFTWMSLLLKQEYWKDVH